MILLLMLEGSNRIIRKISKKNKFIYQKVIVYEFVLKNSKKMGLALMDGKFFLIFQRSVKQTYFISCETLSNKTESFI